MHKLKEFRKSFNFTQKEIAEKLGVTTGTYKSYENNFCRLNDEILLKLSKIYKVSIDALLNNTDKDIIMYSEEQKQGIQDYLNLQGPFLTMANAYLSNLLKDQTEIEQQKKKQND